MLQTNQIGGACEPIRQTQIDQQYRQLEGVTAENEKLVGELNERFRAVLRQENPTSDNVKSAPEEMLVPLADNLRALMKCSVRTNSLLRSILERSEI